MGSPQVPPRYRVLGPLGRGAEASVLLVEDLAAGGVWRALKWVHVASDPDAEARLAEEFLTLSRLAHPGLARVRDFGVVDGAAYFTADHVPGRTLLQLETRDPEVLADLLHQALLVLEYLHRRETRHGDVKPSNLLVEPCEEDGRRRWRLRLVDFGGAQLLHGGLSGRDGRALTHFLSTPAYAPPPALDPRHRARGDAGSRGPGAVADPDLWALGMTWLQLLVGHLPFDVQDPRAIEAWHARGEAASPRRWSDDAPPALDEIVRGLTDPDPRRRLPRAADARRLLASRVSLPPPPRVARSFSLHGREPLLRRIEAKLATHGSVRVVAAPGSGATTLLEALSAREQARGQRVVTLRDPGDVDGLERLLPSQHGARGPGAALSAARIWSELDGPVTLLVDAPAAEPSGNGKSSPCESVVATLVAEAARQRGALRCVQVVRTGSPDDSSCELRGLEREDLERLAADFFKVEAVPSGVVDALLPHAARPAEVWRRLDLAARAGARSDFLGELELPKRARRCLERGPDADSTDREVSASPSFEELCLAEHAIELGASELARLHGGEPSGWSLALEDAVRRGRALRIESHDGTRRYRSTADGPPRRSHPLDGAAEQRARRAAANGPPAREGLTALGSDEAPSLELLVASAARDWREDRSDRALRRLLSGIGRLESRGRDAAAWRVLLPVAQDLVDSPTRVEELATRRTRALTRWRAAQLGLRLGEVESVARLVACLDEGDPAWFRSLVHVVRAELGRRAGDPSRARDGFRLAASERSGLDRWRRLGWRAAELRAAFESGAGEGAALLETLREEPPIVGVSAGEMVLPAARRRAVDCLSTLAACEAGYGDPTRARRCLEAALRVARADGRPRDELLREPLRQLSVLLASEGKRSEALEALGQLERLAKAAGDRVAELEALYNRALLCLRGGELETAEALFREARRRSDALGPHPYRASVWLGLAGVLRDRGRPLAALRLYRRVLRLGEAARASDLVLAHNNLGEIYQAFGRLDSSERERESAVQRARSLGKPFLLGVTLRNLGAIRLARGRVEEARASLEEARSIGESAVDTRFLGGVEFYLALLAAPGERIGALRRARSLCRRLGDSVYATDATLALLAELLARGRRAATRAWFARRPEIPARSRFIAEALRERVAERFPTDPGGLVSAIENAEASGERWQALVALRQTLREPGLSPSLERSISDWRDALEVRFQLRSPRAPVDATASTDGAPSSSAREAPAPATATGDLLAEGSSLEPEPGAWLRAASPRAAPEAPDDAPGDASRETAAPDELVDLVLESLRRDVAATAVELWTPAGVRRSGNPEASLGATLAAARSGDELVVQPEALGVRLPTSGERVLLAAADVSARTRARFEEAAAILTLSFRAEEARVDLARERERSDALRLELRRLREATDAPELDTALISRRGELRDAMERSTARGSEPVAESRSLREILSRLPRLAGGELSVLLLGESGVGKDRLARWIHELSPRRERPFLAETCAIPASLLEAELFGWVQGAFSGAEADHDGILVRAEGGTLYLDEISELPAELQGRLLRVLDDRLVRPLGATSPRAVEFRVLASSRARSVEELFERGLRRDLYFRLGGVVLEIPPLRERLEDLPALVHRFVEEAAQARRGRPARIEPGVLEKLAKHSWPGNVRELENEIRRALLESPAELRLRHVLAGEPGRPGATPAPGRDPSPVERDFRRARDAFEKKLVEAALLRHAGNATRAAEDLGLSRRYLGKLLEKHALELERWKEAPENGKE